MPSTDKELEALFYATNGLNWTKSDNWLVGNPCTDQWFGITCNSNGNIIGMYVISAIDVLVVATGSERECVCIDNGVDHAEICLTTMSLESYQIRLIICAILNTCMLSRTC
jgi:hypothetical protein